MTRILKRFGFALALNCVLASSAWSVVAFDATANSLCTSCTSLTFALTTSGSDRLLIVGAGWGDTTGSITGVTYNSVALTSVTVVNNSSDANSHMWQLIAPNTGANNVVISASETMSELVGGAVTFTGVDQTTPLGTAATNSGNSTTITVTVSSATDEIVIDAMAFGNTGATVDASQTARWDRDGSVLTSGGGSTEAGAASTVMSWSLPGGGRWATIGVGVKPVSAGAAPNFYRRRVGG